MIKEAITRLVEGENLSQEHSASVMNEIMNNEATEAQIGSFVTALRMKGETVSEITGMAQTMREKSLNVPISLKNKKLVDTAGTGGDGQNTMNVSTAAAIVASAAGAKVAKHGNRAVSSMCGSADILEAVGVKVDLSPDGVTRCIDEVGIGFMFAPIFHPAMRYAATPRRDIGIRTVFNILGPLTNPANADAQVLGVADSKIGHLMAQSLALLGTQRAMVVHGNDGMDELSITGATSIWELSHGEISSYTIAPEDVNMKRAELKDLQGGNLERNRDLFNSVLQGIPSPALDIVLLNAAATLVVAEEAKNLSVGVERAREAIVSGAALEKIGAFAKLSQKLS
jgi:anthranilate phosphoribosyltransferase